MFNVFYKLKILTIRNEYDKIHLVIKMEKRIAKIIVGKAGGTAGNDSKTYKVSLPSKWINELNLTDSQVELTFDGEKIVISPRLNLQDFSERKTELGHRLIMVKLYDDKTLCTKICADFTDKTLIAENYTKNIVKTAFGENCVPSWDDFERFLEERCMPKSRAGIREYLETIGIDEYNPIEIIKKTKGRMAEDKQWLELEEM